MGELEGGADGNLVGLELGRGLGEPVGFWVGTLVGASVGNNEGARLGRSVGWCVGRLVGSRIGNAVGSRLGICDGSAVGSNSPGDDASLLVNEMLVRCSRGRGVGRSPASSSCSISPGTAAAARDVPGIVVVGVGVVREMDVAATSCFVTPAARSRLASSRTK